MLLVGIEDLGEVLEGLRQGQTAVFPTESSYGLGCDASDQAAVDKIFAIKGRPAGKPVLVVVPTVEVAQEYLQWNETLEKLAQAHWPGPLTVVGQAKQRLAQGVVAEDGTLALRVTRHPVSKALSEGLGEPLVATSANPAGGANLYSAQEVEVAFAAAGTKPDFILDGGQLESEPPTTLVRVVDNKPEVLRQGSVVV